MRLRLAVALLLAGCGSSVDAGSPDAASDADAATAADAPIGQPDAPPGQPDAPVSSPDAPLADATPPSPPDARTPDAPLPDAPAPPDALAPPDARPADARPADARPPDAATPPPDAGPEPPPTCDALRLTWYDVETNGACEVMDVPEALPQIGRDGLTAAIAEAWWNGSYSGGGPAEACGECWEITTAHATRTVVVTDQCPVEGNPICNGSFFHFDLAHSAAIALDYEDAGRVYSEARRVPCPVSGSIQAVVRDANPTFIRLALANHRIAIRQVDFRGAGPGVSGENPWTAMYRDGGPWGAVGDLKRGGTGVALRMTSAEGQVVESESVITFTGPFPRRVDLGVQVDAAPAVGPSCKWRVPDPYEDGFGGIDQVKWDFTAWEQHSATVESHLGCRAGTCFAISVGEFGGFTWHYNEDFARAGLGKLILHARSPDAAPIEVKLVGPGGDCTGVSKALTNDFARIEVDLATACASQARLQGIQVQVMRASGGSVVLDDAAFE